MKNVAIIAAGVAVVCFILAAGGIMVSAYQAAGTAVAGDAGFPGVVAAIVSSTGVSGLAAVSLSAVIAATALGAAYRFGLFRESEPRLNIAQDIHWQPVGQSYLLVAVKATLHNNSKVLIRSPRAVCQLQQTGPMDDEDVADIYADNLRNNPSDANQYAWWHIGAVARHWSQNDLAIEPDERCQVTFEFIIARAVTGLRIVTTVYKDQTDFAWMAYDYLNISAPGAGGTSNDELDEPEEADDRSS